MGQASNPQEDEGSGSGRFAETTGRPREICSNLRCASASPWSWKADCSANTHSAPWSHVTTRSPGHAHFRGRAGGARAGPAAERPSPTGPRGPCTVSVPGDSHINDVLGGTQVPTTASSGPRCRESVLGKPADLGRGPQRSRCTGLGRLSA